MIGQFFEQGLTNALNGAPMYLSINQILAYYITGIMNMHKF